MGKPLEGRIPNQSVLCPGFAILYPTSLRLSGALVADVLVTFSLHFVSNCPVDKCGRLHRLIDQFEIPEPATRVPLTLRSFALELLPPILVHYAIAYLVLIPNTFALRIGLLPIALWANLRGATRVDISFNDPRLVYFNQGLVLCHIVLAMRNIAWSFVLKPFKRDKLKPTHAPNEHAHEQGESPGIDALDLIINLRGIGWDWSRGLRLPPETRRTNSMKSFTISTFTSLVSHILVFDLIHYAVQWFSPDTIGSPLGGSIYDMTLPLSIRIPRATIITTLSGLAVYSAIQIAYDFSTLVGLHIFGQHPTQWPPLFETPWLATSLTEFWAKRWHQLFRDSFISMGAKPMSLIAGRAGSVVGAFLVSGVLHDGGMWGMGNGTEFSSVGGFFIIQGLGIVLEGLLRKITGHRVGGFFGWVWNTTWVIGWGHLLIDAWARRGLMGSVFIPDQYRLPALLFGSLSRTSR
ncbi:hypothetical protein BDN72DRAFT_758403 [Pluteus cervinus]|uniref:Uncharacterized protein n=1 Tax=Pluteus cervinus TaxID=181527 RepID=A0ACD3BBB4_9AGAR|nr:hypothetical protein BDN72DRAFT_758403 [Pluteus cervinus]